jgi:hypothetical protein
MNKFLSHFGSGILGVAVTLLIMWTTGKFNKQAPEVITQIDQQIIWIDTCFTVEELEPIAEDIVKPGKPVKQKPIADTMWRIELDTIEIICKPAIEYFEFNHKDSLLEIYEMIAIKGCDIEIVDFDRKITMDTLIKHKTFEKTNTVLLKPEAIPVPYKKNRVKLGYHVSNLDQWYHGPKIGYELKNGIQFGAIKYLHDREAFGLEAEISIFSFK